MSSVVAEKSREIDSRIAERGGYHKSPGDGHYEYPGMTPRKDWRRTRVHQATSWYGCSLCGTKFGDPHAVYTHLGKRHNR